jgi:GT2 family glycosyltransferase
MKTLHLCIPVLKRHDLLRQLLLSLHDSTVRPVVHVIDNGRNPATLSLINTGFAVDLFTPTAALGLAESWNWFIKNVPEERLISNDDLTFTSTSLEKLITTPGDFVSALAGTNACSCFLLRDSCVAKVGLFDETISPGYAYFEDCDYVERMLLAGVKITGVECGVVHLGSQTLAKNSPSEWAAHNDKFLIAQSNFIKKYGRLPDLSRASILDPLT